MKTTMERLENSRVRLTVECDAEALEEAIQGAYRRVAKRITIPGFRKGRAPRKLIELNYGPEVFFEDAVDILFPKAYKQALDETGIQAVDQPDVDIEEIDLGTGVTFKIEVDVYPEVELGTYFGLEAEKEKVNVTEEDVDRILRDYQNRSAELIVVDSRTDVQEGDYAIIDFAGYIDGEPFSGGAAQDHMLQVGSGQFIPGFEEQLVGMNVGETKDVVVTFPEDYHAEHLAGKEATFKVTIKELKERIVPELDDDFAKDISESASTLAELREEIRKNLEEEAERRTTVALENKLLDKIGENSKIELPQSMVRHQAEHLVDDFFMNMLYQGISRERYLEITNQTEEQLVTQFEGEAARRLRNDLILEAVAKAEGIEVSDEEVAAEIDRRVAENEGREEEARKYFESQKESLRLMLERQKTIEAIVEHAQITEVEAGAEPEQEDVPQDNE
ncbi:MAG TPA: trigger factor [Firmicutes bacterium]|jgi:trigger factor|nr:trigger factor [Bacillota bacterium]